jgi:hypothetical protein
MRNTKNQWKVTMVNLEQLKKKRNAGFKTPKAIKTFCSRYHINAFWWRPPQGNKKIYMVDEQMFWRCFKEANVGKNVTTTRTTTRTPSRFTKLSTKNYKHATKPVRMNTRTRTYSSAKNSNTKKTYRRAA